MEVCEAGGSRVGDAGHKYKPLLPVLWQKGPFGAIVCTAGAGAEVREVGRPVPVPGAGIPRWDQ